MQGQPWTDLKSATLEFIEALTKTSNPGDKITCINYNHNARIVFREATPSNDLNAKIDYQIGYTHYASALKMASQISAETHDKYTQLVYYFMSDGAPNDEYRGMQEVENIKKAKWISKVQFYAVGFGGT